MKTICLAFFALSISSSSLLVSGPFDAGMQEKLPPQEYSALVDLYNSTAGGGWTDNTGWLDGNAGYWYAVYVSGEQYDNNGDLIATGNVLSVGLSGNGLKGTLPLTLGNLTQLVSLVLNANQLSGMIPTTLGNLTNLQLLDLNGNQLSGAIPSTVGSLINLQVLSLGANS